MFHKKHTVKDVQALGKSDAKKLKSNVLSTLGDDFGDVLDAVWDKKGAVSRRRWQFGPGVSSVLYLVNDLPLVLSVDGLPADTDDLFTKAAVKGALVPTVFFLLRARQFLLDAPDRYTAFLGKFGVSVFCRGPTSRFLISGAHLMMPGILGVSDADTRAGALAVVCSVGTDAPYAVGFVTSHLANKEGNGVGVYVVNCFVDSLWQEFEPTFVASCTDKSGERLANPLPPEFTTAEVLENLSASEAPGARAEPLAHEDTAADGAAEGAIGPDDDKHGDGPASVGYDAEDKTPVPEDEDTPAKHADASSLDLAALFPDEDAVLTFAFYEGVKTVPPSLLPLPLTQFIALVVNAYPRISEKSKPIEFKNTKHKRALTFLKDFGDVVEITEVSPGVHSITKVNKSSVLVRDHNRTFKEFLETVQKPAKEKEARAAEMRLLEDKRTVFNQQIVSVESNYRPRQNPAMPNALAHVLLAGQVSEVVAWETASKKLPTLEDVENGKTGAQPTEELPPIDADACATLYARKLLADNLRAYVKERGLLVIGSGIDGEKGMMPSVKLQGAVSVFASDANPSEMLLNKLEETIMQRHFGLVTEIIMQTSVSGSSAMSEFIPPRHITKHGHPPHINVWTEKRSGNKTITILKNMEALGFDLDIVSRAWRQRFSTSCSVFDPAADMVNLKSGTKIPLEIHVQGDITGKLPNVLTKDLGIPCGLIQYSK